MKSTKTNEKEKPVRPLSVRELSRLLHRSPSHICRVMNGKRASVTLARLLKTFGVEVA